MIKKLFFTAALLVPGLAYAGNPSADLSVQVVPPGGTSNILAGCYQCWNFDGGYHAGMNRYPDFVIDCTYQLPADGGWNPRDCIGDYPLIMEYNMADGSHADPNAAASGSYDGAWAQTVIDHIIPDAAHIYAIRINNEWDYCASGPTPIGSACGTNTIPPATYVAAVQRFINIIKNTLSAHSITNIKIEFDAPMNATQQAYWPGDSYVDLTGYDKYWQTQYLGSDSHAAWTNSLDEINTVAAWGRAHGKQLTIPEWCETYNDGYIITQFASWMASNNVVAHSYWNSNDAIGTGQGYGCIITHDQNNNPLPQKKAAYIAAFGNSSYKRTYWPQYLLLPSPNPY